MDTPLQISWKQIDPSPFIAARIEQEVEKLEKTYGRITSCHVVMEGRSHRHQKGGLYAIRIHLVLPGDKEVTANRNPSDAHEHEDAYVAIRDGFRAIRRRLRDEVRERREAPQHPDTQPHGLVSKLNTEAGYGFIRSDDGREIYFHKNAVLGGDFSHLRVGAEVHFAEEEGDEGPQASTVRPFGVGARD